MPPLVALGQPDSVGMLLRLVGRSMDALYAYMDSRPCGGGLRVVEIGASGDEGDVERLEVRLASPEERFRNLLADSSSPLHRRILSVAADDRGSRIGLLLREEHRVTPELVSMLTQMVEGTGPSNVGRSSETATLPLDFPEVVQEVDESGRVVAVSELWVETLGYSRRGALGRQASEFLAEDSAAFFRRVVEPVLQSRGEVRGLPCQLRTRGGEHIAVSLTSKVVVSECPETGCFQRRRIDLFVQLDQVRDWSASALAREAVAAQRVEQFVPRVLARVRADHRYAAVAYFEFGEGRRPTFVGGQGVLGEPALTKIAQLLGEEVEACGQAVFVEDTRAEPSRPLVDEFASFGIFSGGAFPVASGRDARVGFLMLLSETPRRVGRGETAVLEGICGLIALVDQRDRAVVQQRAESQIAHVTLSAIGEAVIRTDKLGRIEYTNPAAVRLAGVPSVELSGRTVGEALELRSTTDDRRIVDPTTYAELFSHRAGGAGVPATVRWVCATGGHADVEIHVRALRTADGKRTGSVLTLSDVTRTRQLSRELLHRATHDVLSGLFNREEFERNVGECTSRLRTGERGHVLCFLDLDRFKTVNDTCGHAAGDEMIRQLSNQLRTTIRSGDVLARLGGDEFGILFVNCDLENGKRIANGLVQRIREFRFNWGGHQFQVGVSIGCVPIDDPTADAEHLMRLSDRACYLAKENGRNRVEVMLPSEQSGEAAIHGSQWDQGIESALQNGNFMLLGQPIVHIGPETEELDGVEVLLRHVDDSGRQVPPGAFLPAAERFELSTRLDRWVIDRTLSKLSQNPAIWHKLGYCSINLSGQSLADPDLLEFVVERLEHHGVEPRHLGFEFTEADAVAHPRTAGRFVTELSRLGCRFLLDDFGSGLSAFGYLQDLDIEMIKIDGRFVRGMTEQSTDHEVVRAIHQIARATGKRTIAEHVENEETLVRLREIGVDYAQGYAMAKPTELDGLLGLSKSP